MQLYTRIVLVIGTLVVAFGSLTAQDYQTLRADTSAVVKLNDPVFLYMSLSPDGSDAVKLQSIQPDESPVQWDGQGPQYLTSIDIFTGNNIRFELFTSGKPPATPSNFDSKKGILKNGEIYLSGTSVLELSAYEKLRKEGKIYYSINSSAYGEYQNPVIIDKEGIHTVQFYYVDNAGKKFDTGERVLILDTQPPETILDVEGPQHNDVLAATSKIKLTSSDIVAVRSTYYSIDDGSISPYTKPISISHLPQGDHSIRWFSVDKAGNRENEKSYDFYVDRTPPMVFEEIVGNTYMVAGKEFSSGRSQLRIVAVDNKAGIKEIHYSINNEPFRLYEKPIYLSDISGAITIRSFAIDNVGNKSESNVEGQHFSMPLVDISGPTIKHSYSGRRVLLRDTVWIRPETSVVITAKDEVSGLQRLEYKLDDNPSVTYTEPFTNDQDGYHRISCNAWDNVENLNILNFGFGVDGKAPEIYHHFSVSPYRVDEIDGESIPVFPPDVVLYIAATDNRVGIERLVFSINQARESVYTQPLTGFKPKQITTVTIKAIDKLGNTAEQAIRFYVE